MSFQALSLLVKNSLIEVKHPVNLDQEVIALLAKGQTLERAGFTGQAKEMEFDAKELSNAESISNQLKHWNERGYLTIRIKNMEDWAWRNSYNSLLWTYALPPQTHIEKLSSFFGLISRTVETRIASPTLALIGAGEYLVQVPDHILEKAIDFRGQLETDFPHFTNRYPANQFFVLTVADEKKLGSVVRQVPTDPLLLYRIRENRSHLDLLGNFVVIGWWGADIEDIERALQLDKSLFPSVAVHSDI